MGDLAGRNRWPYPRIADHDRYQTELITPQQLNSPAGGEIYPEVVDRGGGEERGVPSWLLMPGDREVVHGEVRRMLRVVVSEQAEQDGLKLDLDALVREGARRMLVAAMKAEADEYVARHVDHRDGAGHALVVRNGVAEPRTVTTAAGELEIGPRVASAQNYVWNGKSRVFRRVFNKSVCR
jgi:hypothetical protein